MAKKCLVLVADGTEEVEAIAVVDALRRAELEVIIAVVRPEGSEQDDLTVVCSRGVRLVGDVRLTADHKTTYDAVVLPGGLKGAETFRDSPIVIELAKDQLQSGRLLAAICAAPGKMTVATVYCHSEGLTELSTGPGAPQPSREPPFNVLSLLQGPA